ncbi:MAG: lysophospholipid acyltransferase family protein [Bacteroidota bacterium]
MLRPLTSIVARLPWRVIYFISGGLALLLRLVYRPKVVDRNLQLAFPSLPVSARGEIRREFYKNFADVSFEIVKSVKISDDAFRERILIEENDALEELRRHNAPFLLYASHYCNWEWIAAAFALSIAPSDILYKPLSNASVDRWVYANRSRYGNRLFPVDQVGSVIRNLEGFRALGIIADQAPKKSNRGKVWTDFLGVPTPFFRGVFALSYLTQWPAYYTSLERRNRGHYTLRVEKIGAPPYEKTDRQVLQGYIKHLQAQLATNPAHWLWTHNRWKYDRQDNEELVIFQD